MKFFIMAMLLANALSAKGATYDSIPPVVKKSHFLHLNENTIEQSRQGRLLLTPFLLPGYSPDIGISLAAGGIFSFKTRAYDSLLPRSSVPVTLTCSTNGAIIASSNWVTFWIHDRLRIYSLIQYRSVKDVYYGVGYNNATGTSYPDSTSYKRSYFVFQARPLWKVVKYLYAGINLDYNQNILWSINAHMNHDANYLQFGQKIVNTGIGVVWSYDSRDFPQNAYRGFYTSAMYTVYSKVMGGNTKFSALDIDSRLYVPLDKARLRTLALNLRSRYEFGTVPFTAMPSFGSPFDLRGYRSGQYRDRYLNYGIAEYRHKFYSRNGKPTRWGMVLWGGMGAIGSDFSGGLFRNELPNLGIGVRFEVQPRLNVRLDLGYSPSHSSLYFNFLEAY